MAGAENAMDYAQWYLQYLDNKNGSSGSSRGGGSSRGRGGSSGSSGSGSSGSGGSGGGSTPRVSEIRGSGNNTGTMNSAKGLETRKEKDKRSGGRIVK